jgi:hypothetical protein
MSMDWNGGVDLPWMDRAREGEKIDVQQEISGVPHTAGTGWIDSGTFAR